jgi:hypothetical protein
MVLPVKPSMNRKRAFGQSLRRDCCAEELDARLLRRRAYGETAAQKSWMQDCCAGEPSARLLRSRALSRKKLQSACWFPMGIQAKPSIN